MYQLWIANTNSAEIIMIIYSNYQKQFQLQSRTVIRNQFTVFFHFQIICNMFLVVFVQNSDESFELLHTTISFQPLDQSLVSFLLIQSWNGQNGLVRFGWHDFFGHEERQNEVVWIDAAKEDSRGFVIQTSEMSTGCCFCVVRKYKFVYNM